MILSLCASLVLINDIYYYFYLLLWMNVRGDAGNPNFVNAGQAHVQVLRDVVVLPSRNET